MIEEGIAQPEIQEVSQSKTSPIPQAKTKKPWLIISLVLLLFTSLGASAYLAYQNYQLKQEIRQKTAVSISETPSPEPTEDPTSSWKTYLNQTYGYRVKHPPSWYLYEPETTIAYSKNTVGFWPEKGEGEVFGIWVTIRDDRFNFTDLDSWWEQYKKALITPIDEYAIEEKKYLEENFDNLIKTERTTVSGQPALKVETTEDYPTRGFRSVFVINKNNEIVDINTNITNSNSPYFAFFDQILSTFKFINSNEETKKNQALTAAEKYLDAYINQVWEVARALCRDDKFNEEIAESYGLVDYKILSSSPDSDPNYYHVYISLTDKNGETKTINPASKQPIELLMFKDENGSWKSLTWYFFP